MNTSSNEGAATFLGWFTVICFTLVALFLGYAIWDWGYHSQPSAPASSIATYPILVGRYGQVVVMGSSEDTVHPFAYEFMSPAKICDVSGNCFGINSPTTTPTLDSSSSVNTSDVK